MSTPGRSRGAWPGPAPAGQRVALDDGGQLRPGAEHHRDPEAEARPDRLFDDGDRRVAAGPEALNTHVAALDVGRASAKPMSTKRGAQVRHGHLGVAADVDPAEHGDVGGHGGAVVT